MVETHCLSYDGKVCVTSSNDRTIKFWNVKTETCLRTVDIDSFPSQIWMSPYGWYIALRTWENTVMLYESLTNIFFYEKLFGGNHSGIGFQTLAIFDLLRDGF